MLYEDDEHLPQIKLIDFGCAKTYLPGEIMTNCCGSMFYIAPEVWFNYYNHQCDVWSIGIIIFALVNGRFPFDDKDETKIEGKIKNKKLKFKKKEKKLVSKPFRKLIKALLCKDANKRITAKLCFSKLIQLLTVTSTQTQSSIHSSN